MTKGPFTMKDLEEVLRDIDNDPRPKWEQYFTGRFLLYMKRHTLARIRRYHPVTYAWKIRVMSSGFVVAGCHLHDNELNISMPCINYHVLVLSTTFRLFGIPLFKRRFNNPPNADPRILNTLLDNLVEGKEYRLIDPIIWVGIFPKTIQP